MVQLIVQLHPMHQTGYGTGRTQLLSSREENKSSLGTAVQHNFGRTLLVPSRVKNISSLGFAVQQNYKRTLLVPSREENIKRLGRYGTA